MIEDNGFLQAFRGSFIGALHWHQLDALWHALQSRTGAGWYIYTVGETPPCETASLQQVGSFIQEIDALLRREHQEDYCGIVYTDDFQVPSFIKIYNPSNLGAVCGYSANPPLPGWILSLIPPIDLSAALPLNSARRPWWQSFFSRTSKGSTTADNGSPRPK